MIKIITEYKVKKGGYIQPILAELRTAAMQYPGFVSAENLLNEGDIHNIVVISTWQTLDDWRAWEESIIGTNLYQQSEALLVEKPKVVIYRIMPTQKWA